MFASEEMWRNKYPPKTVNFTGLRIAARFTGPLAAFSLPRVYGPNLALHFS
jgi:hypothetical protein